MCSLQVQSASFSPNGAMLQNSQVKIMHAWCLVQPFGLALPLAVYILASNHMQVHVSNNLFSPQHKATIVCRCHVHLLPHELVPLLERNPGYLLLHPLVPLLERLGTCNPGIGLGIIISHSLGNCMFATFLVVATGP